jgi:hypothetical protein
MYNENVPSLPITTTSDTSNPKKSPEQLKTCQRVKNELKIPPPQHKIGDDKIELAEAIRGRFETYQGRRI